MHCLVESICVQREHQEKLDRTDLLVNKQMAQIAMAMKKLLILLQDAVWWNFQALAPVPKTRMKNLNVTLQNLKKVKANEQHRSLWPTSLEQPPNRPNLLQVKINKMRKKTMQPNNFNENSNSSPKMMMRKKALSCLPANTEKQAPLIKPNHKISTKQPIHMAVQLTQETMTTTTNCRNLKTTLINVNDDQ